MNEPHPSVPSSVRLATAAKAPDTTDIRPQAPRTVLRAAGSMNKPGRRGRKATARVKRAIIKAFGPEAFK